MVKVAAERLPTWLAEAKFRVPYDTADYYHLFDFYGQPRTLAYLYFYRWLAQQRDLEMC